MSAPATVTDEQIRDAGFVVHQEADVSGSLRG
jgi:hypothetical protein